MRKLEPGDFWARVEVTAACWLWRGDTHHDGYGRIKYRGRQWRAHRLAYALHHGELPDDALVCHACDTPLCVRPEHLWLGTSADNTADRNAKGRTAKGDTHGWRRGPDRRVFARGDANGSRRHPERLRRGEANPAAKLTADAVRCIRELYAAGGTSHAKLAARFGVSPTLIGNIVRRRTWRVVTDAVIIELGGAS